jgi:hypothetical protein
MVGGFDAVSAYYANCSPQRAFSLEMQLAATVEQTGSRSVNATLFDAAFAAWRDLRRGERDAVIPHERRVTLNRPKAASSLLFVASICLFDRRCRLLAACLEGPPLLLRLLPSFWGNNSINALSVRPRVVLHDLSRICSWRTCALTRTAFETTKWRNSP